MSDPLDELFVTGEEAQKLNRDKQLADLAVYLDRMPSELKPLFRERFALIDSAELAQLRAAAAERDALLRELNKTINELIAANDLATQLRTRINALETYINDIGEAEGYLPQMDAAHPATPAPEQEQGNQ